MSAPHPDDDLLILLAEGEAPGEDAAALEAHVRECLACRERLERWRGRADWLKARCAGFREPPPLALPGGNVLRLGTPRLFRVAAAILLAAGLVWFLLPARSVARVEWVRGDSGAAPALRAGEAVRPGTAIETGARRMGLRAGERLLLVADERTRLAWLAPDRVRLDAGRIAIHGASAGFVVETPAGSIRDLGTSFLAECGPDGASVTVLDGRVRLEPAGGRPLEMGTLEQAALRPGAASRMLTPVQADRLLSWAREAAMPEDWEDVSLGEILDRLAETSPYRFEASERIRRIRVTAALEGLSSEEIADAAARAAGATMKKEGSRLIFEEGGGGKP